MKPKNSREESTLTICLRKLKGGVTKKTKRFDFSEALIKLQLSATLQAANDFKITTNIITKLPDKDDINLIEKTTVCFARENSQASPELHDSLCAFVLTNIGKIKRLASKIMLSYYDHMLERRGTPHNIYNTLIKHTELKFLYRSDFINSFKHFPCKKSAKREWMIKYSAWSNKQQTQQLMAYIAKTDLFFKSSTLKIKSKLEASHNRIITSVNDDCIPIASTQNNFIKQKNANYITKNFASTDDLAANKFRISLENLARRRTDLLQRFYPIKNKLSWQKVSKRNDFKSSERS